MTRDALPLPEIQNPRVSEASDVIVWLSLICALRVVNPGDNGGIAEEIHLKILDICQFWLEVGIFYISKKALLVADFAIVLGVHKTAGDQRVKGRRVPVDLGLIPQPFEHEQFSLARIGLLREGDRTDNQEQRKAESASHELPRSRTFLRRRAYLMITIVSAQSLPKCGKKSYQCHPPPYVRFC